MKSIKTALLSSFILITFSCLLITFLLTIGPVNDMVIEQTGAQILKQLNLAGDDYYALVKGGAAADIQAAALRTAKAINGRVTVIDPKGRVLADSDVPAREVASLENHYYRPEIREAADEGVGKAVRYSATTKKDFIYVAVPLKDRNSRIAAFLRFSMPKTYAYGQDLKMLRPFLVAALISLAIAVLLSMIFSSLFARPIVRLSEFARQISAGNFPGPFAVRSRYEIGELEEALEGMSRDLSRTFGNLTAEKDRMNAILSAMVEGVIAVDDGGKVMAINESARKMFLIEGDIVGKNAVENVRNSEISDMIRGSLAGERAGEREVKIFSPQEKNLLVQSARIGKGGAVLVMHDITNLKKLEKIRSEFAANVSHELKTPLTSIKASAETLTAGAIEDNKEAAEFLEKIRKNTERLSALIDDVMELSELETGRLAGKAAAVGIGEAVDAALDAVSAKMKARKIRLTVALDDPSAGLLCGREHLQRVLINLLDNAVKYNKEGGSIEVSSRSRNGSMTITIKDTGIGIEQKHLPRIFERFYTVDRSRSRELGGTGLGLAIVKHIVELYGGEIGVESAPGEGSAFSFTLKTA